MESSVTVKRCSPDISPTSLLSPHIQTKELNSLPVFTVWLKGFSCSSAFIIHNPEPLHDASHKKLFKKTEKTELFSPLFCPDHMRKQCWLCSFSPDNCWNLARKVLLPYKQKRGQDENKRGGGNVRDRERSYRLYFSLSTSGSSGLSTWKTWNGKTLKWFLFFGEPKRWSSLRRAKKKFCRNLEMNRETHFPLSAGDGAQRLAKKRLSFNYLFFSVSFQAFVSVLRRNLAQMLKAMTPANVEKMSMKFQLFLSHKALENHRQLQFAQCYLGLENSCPLRNRYNQQGIKVAMLEKERSCNFFKDFSCFVSSR